MDTKLGLAGIGHSVQSGRHRALARILSRPARLFPGGQGGRAPGRDATAVNHFCLECDDLDVTAARLRDAGVKLTVESKMGLDGNRQCWIEDPDGNRIEFMQMSPSSMQVEAIRRLRTA